MKKKWVTIKILERSGFPLNHYEYHEQAGQGLGLNILNGNSENLTPPDQLSLAEQNNKCYFLFSSVICLLTAVEDLEFWENVAASDYLTPLGRSFSYPDPELFSLSLI